VIISKRRSRRVGEPGSPLGAAVERGDAAPAIVDRGADFDRLISSSHFGRTEPPLRHGRAWVQPATWVTTFIFCSRLARSGKAGTKVPEAIAWS